LTNDSPSAVLHGSAETVSVSVLKLLLGLVGPHATGMLAACGLPSALLDDPDGRVPLATMARLADDAARAFGTADVGLYMAAHGPNGSMGVPDYAVQASATLGEAYRRVTRFYRLVLDAGDAELIEERDRARLVLRTNLPRLDVLRHFPEGWLGAWLRRGRELTGVAWSPTMVRFRHSQPASIDAHRRFFGAPIAFDQRVDELEFDASLLGLAIRTSEPPLAGILDRVAQDMLDRLPVMNDFARKARRIVANSFAQGTPTLDRIAEQLKTTSRTLQRRLARDGLSLRTLIDDARHELALRYIARTELSIGEVAFLLGFDQVTSFHRAFRRWTGATPLQFRNRQA
jgi:AraC-like DNA-binding protein